MSQVPGLDQLPADAGGIKAERRHLTVLFCDVVGSSALSTRLDPEDLRHILRAFQNCCGDAIRNFDGHIARYMGDGILAYFGFPAAHEDDAERAVRAALQAIKSVSALSFPGTTPIEIRIGIATGLVVVGDLIGEGPSREFALIGEAPNLAAQLQQLAKPNQILVASNTQRLLGQLFELEDLGEQQVKGHSNPVRIWSVLRSSGVASRFEARRSAHLTPFIGRDAELVLLHECFGKAKAGKGQFVAISGEPGIGKSRLITTFRRQLPRDSCRPLLFQCSSYHTSSPWYPVIRHLEDALDVSYDAPSSLKLQKLEALMDDVPHKKRALIVPLLASLLGIPTDPHYPPLDLTPQIQKQRTFAAMLELLLAQSERQPILLICEDIHWIDHTSLELLDLLRQNVSNRQIMVIASFRPEFNVPNGMIASINLSRLSPVLVVSMVKSLDDNGELPTPVIQQIVSKTDGVPLFVEEVTKTILNDDLGTKGQVSGFAWNPNVPDTLHDSLMARLDRLTSTKTVAQVSAAIGREFAFELLEAVAPLPRQDVREAINRLQEAGLLHRRERSAVEMYSFKHALVQDAAYASMLRDERHLLHVRIAETLATKFVDVAEGAPEIVAFHYTQAREITPAIHQWLKAGRQASKRSAFMEAITHFQTALKLLEELQEDAQRFELELQLQQSLASASIAAKGFGADETMRALNRALNLCEKLGDTPQVFPVLNGLVGVHLMRGEFERARAVAQNLLALAQHSEDKTALLMGHRVLGMSLFVAGELNAAKRELQSAMELYDPEKHAALALVFSQDFRATAQAYLGLASVLLGDAEGGVAHGRDALAYAQHLRHWHSICYVLSFLAGAYLIAGNPRAAYPVAERTIASSTEHGFPQWSAGGLMLRGWARIDLGEVEAGLADIRNSIGGLEATGTLIWMQFAHFLLARALVASRELEPALELVDKILVEIGATGSRWYEAEIHRLKGDILRSQGKSLSEIESCYEAAISVARRQGARVWELGAVEALGALRELSAQGGPLGR